MFCFERHLVNCPTEKHCANHIVAPAKGWNLSRRMHKLLLGKVFLVLVLANHNFQHHYDMVSSRDILASKRPNVQPFPIEEHAHARTKYTDIFPPEARKHQGSQIVYCVISSADGLVFSKSQFEGWASDFVFQSQLLVAQTWRGDSVEGSLENAIAKAWGGPYRIRPDLLMTQAVESKLWAMRIVQNCFNQDENNPFR